MATDHQFGGNWTDTKLQCLDNYLRSYRAIMSSNEKAKYFRTWYVDAFAGTGERVDKADRVARASLFDDFYDDEETESYRRGSVDIALSLTSPFDKYLLIEKSASRLAQLRDFLSAKHQRLKDQVSCIEGDANTVLLAWIRERDWRKDRAVVFLDPYGLQVEWSTIQALGATGGVDLWYLFPIGMGPMRMIPSSGFVPEAWGDKLDRLFGTPSWRERFFVPSSQTSLFTSEPQFERAVSETIVSQFVKERLRSAFHSVADGMVLHNSKSSPMYLLCFAASNAKGAGPAMRIARSILGK